MIWLLFLLPSVWKNVSFTLKLPSGNDIARGSWSDRFKDSYVLEFLQLPANHSEEELQKAILASLKDFILEIGRDFCFMGQEYKIQVGDSDFSIDLLFYHRGLHSLVAFELKNENFHPSHLGQLEFYLDSIGTFIFHPRSHAPAWERYLDAPASCRSSWSGN